MHLFLEFLASPAGPPSVTRLAVFIWIPVLNDFGFSMGFRLFHIRVGYLENSITCEVLQIAFKASCKHSLGVLIPMSNTKKCLLRLLFITIHLETRFLRIDFLW